MFSTGDESKVRVDADVELGGQLNLDLLGWLLGYEL
jgi:hypothetical protein